MIRTWRDSVDVTLVALIVLVVAVWLQALAIGANEDAPWYGSDKQGLAAAAAAPGVSRIKTPAFPSQGIAYVQGGNLWVVRLDGSSVQLSSTGSVSYPKWSAEGDRIAAVVDGQLAVFASGREGAIVGPIGAGVDFAWSPSGSSVAYASSGSLWLWDAKADPTAKPVRLIPGDPRETIERPIWSPDGTQIAFGYARRDAAGQLTATGYGTVDRSGARRPGFEAAIPQNGVITVAGWAGPSTVAYWQALAFGASISADGSPLYANVTRISDGTLVYPDIFAPRVGHPGEIAIVEGFGRETWRLKSIALAKVPAGAVRLAGQAAGSVLAPAWAPDGRRIAYVAAPEGPAGASNAPPPHDLLMARRIYVQDVDAGTAAVRLTGNPDYRDEKPTWLGDTGELVFARFDATDEASLWLLSPALGTARKLAAGLSLPSSNGGDAWFGSFGHIDWDYAFSVWQPPR